MAEVVDDEIWQSDEGEFKPWRRAAAYDERVVELPLDDVKDDLELTSRPSWGYQLRRGLVPLSDRDLEVIRAAMTRTESH